MKEFELKQAYFCSCMVFGLTDRPTGNLKHFFSVYILAVVPGEGSSGKTRTIKNSISFCLIIYHKQRIINVNRETYKN